MSAFELSVIIPTLGVRPELLRAIASVYAQQAFPAVPVVVVNGNRADPAIMEAARADPRTQVIVTPVPGVAHARLLGRQAIQTPFFALLDDDDEILPDSLAPVVAAFAPDVDVVATNGFTEYKAERQVKYRAIREEDRDFALVLIRDNWLCSGGIFCRTAAAPERFFEGLPNYMEMTYLAMRLALHCRIRRIDVPTFVYHLGGADQATRTAEFLYREPEVLRQIEAEVARPDVLAGLRHKRSAALHECSGYEWQHGRLWRAWAYHLESLFVGDGIRYLPYTRSLLAATLFGWSRRFARPDTAGPESALEQR